MNNEKERQKAQYANMDWDHLAVQQRGMSFAQRTQQVEAMLAGVKVPPGANRNQQYEVDRIAKATNTENFDVIAERISMLNDSRIKKSVTSKGQNEYYLWFRSPLTKFRGFWGTLLMTYWLPAILIIGLIGPGWILMGNVFSFDLLSERQNNPFVNHKGGLLLVAAACNIFFLYWVWSFLAASRRYFWLARMTGNKTANGRYAHQLMGLASFIFLFALAIFVAMAITGEGRFLFSEPMGIVVSPSRWPEIAGTVFIAFRLWFELLIENPKWFVILAFAPNLVIISFASMGSGPAFPLLFTLKDELLNHYGHNEGFEDIAHTIDKLESQGDFIGGVRQQGMLRLKLAYTAERMLGKKQAAATGFYLMILVIVALVPIIYIFR